ncbi:MAG: c-type cytochrome [Xanthomonadales bacterium]|nr:c-type cytochrome [Xanthomonadales bacterium]
MNVCIRIVTGLLLLTSLQAQAEAQAGGQTGGDAAVGQAKSAICAACHGPDGNSMVPQWPKLAGQHAAYLERQTILIKSGARPVPEMAGIVASMSEQDFADLAAYYATQKNNGGLADETLSAQGEQLWRAGNAETGVPACMACHGPGGGGNPLSGYPALAGQHGVYTSKMLERFRAGENWGEKDASSRVMNGVAARLSDEEIAAVASFIQGLYLAVE